MHLLLLLSAATFASNELAIIPPEALWDPPLAPAPPPLDWTADRLDARLLPGEETAITLSWDLAAVDAPLWVDLPLAAMDLVVDTATVDGRPLSLVPDPSDGRWHAAVLLDGPTRLVVTGRAPSPQDALRLTVLPAARMTVRNDARGLDLEVAGAVRGRDGVCRLPTAEVIDATWRPQEPPPERPPVVSAEQSTALQVDDSGVQGEAVIRYQISGGSVDSLAFSVSGAVDDVGVTGPGVTRFERQGDRVEVSFGAPVRGRVALHVSLRMPGVGETDTPAPLVQAEATLRAATVSVLAADETLIVPQARGGLEPVADSSLPDWAQGLVDGRPIATWRQTNSSPALTVRSLSLKPLDEPPTLVDEARYEVLYTEHGRLVLRMRLNVRNDRRQYLRVAVPPGWDLIAARVAGRTVRPAWITEPGQAPVLVLPLEKSVETLRGLVAFPVEVAFFGEEAAWDPRGTRALSTPSVDAPVAYARWELHLPVGLESRDIEGLPTLVGSWTPAGSAMAYGRGYGTTIDDQEEVEPVTTADARDDRPRRDAGRVTYKATTEIDYEQQEARAEASTGYWNEAYSAYKNNDFEAANQLLAQSLAMDPSNSAAQALQSNVDLLLGKGGEAAQDEGAARRVVEMARAKTTDQTILQEELEVKLQEQLRSGDLEEAEKTLQSYERVTSSLARVEQKEANAQKLKLESAKKQAESVRDQRRQRASASANAYGAERSPVQPTDATTSSYRRASRKTPAPAAPPEAIEAPPDRDADGLADQMDRYDDKPAYTPSTWTDADETWKQYETGDILDDLYLDLQDGTELLMPMEFYGGFGASGNGVGGGGYGEGHGTLSGAARSFQEILSASPASVIIPNAGQVLRFEQRLLRPDEPLTLTLTYRTAR